MIKDILRELRTANTLTQEDTAKILGVSRTGYASWEQGKADPSIEDIKKICVLFNVTPNELLEFDTYEQAEHIKSLLNIQKMNNEKRL